MKSLPLFLAALFFSLPAARADFVLQPNDTLAICGDSITEQKIYSVFIEDYLLMCQPVDGLRVIQFGWGGEQASGFCLRIGRDVLPFKPNVVTTCYGMNDGLYKAMDPSTGDKYRSGEQKVIDLLKAGGVRTIVVGSPGVVDSTYFNRAFPGSANPPEVYNHTLGALRDIAEEVAKKNGLLFADVHTPMLETMAKAKAALGKDYPVAGGGGGGGIHPNDNGHLIMAYAFLKALGCDGAIGTITVDLDANQATGSPGQEIVSCDKGAVTVKSTRYPFCFQGDPAKPDPTTASIVKFFPFNDELNRYLLVVKGLKGAKAKVTWGTQSKEFAAADLAKGVNLAAEFFVNPFCDQFFKVHGAVQGQQILETMLIRSYLADLNNFKSQLPDQAQQLNDLATAGLKRDETLLAAAKSQVIPIQHTIQITAEP